MPQGKKNQSWSIRGENECYYSAPPGEGGADDMGTGAVTHTQSVRPTTAAAGAVEAEVATPLSCMLLLGRSTAASTATKLLMDPTVVTRGPWPPLPLCHPCARKRGGRVPDPDYAIVCVGDGCAAAARQC
jgi:hypothetical protein